MKPIGSILKPIVFSILAVGAGFALVRYLSAGAQAPSKTAIVPKATVKPSKINPPSHVSALGHLEPADKVRDLAAPTLSTDVTPTIASIEVDEGQHVRKGQVLAIFDTKERLASERQAILARLSSIQAQVKILERDTSRFRDLTQQNAYPKSELEAKELALLALRTDLTKANSDLKLNEVDQRKSVLVSPISGRILKINAHAGERPNPYGMIKVGETARMVAIAQVDEQYIGRISLGQNASIRSENKSFGTRVYGKVISISPIVGPRKDLSISPKAESDTESRTIDVAVEINPSFNPVVSDLTGTKVIVTFL
jgi:HlyD family secretion protein